MQKPIIEEMFADNGEHSHWKLIDSSTGETLWEQLEPKQLLQQTQCTTPLEFLEQMLIDAEMQKPANVEPLVLNKAVQKVQALKCVIKMIKDSQLMA